MKSLFAAAFALLLVGSTYSQTSDDLKMVRDDERLLDTITRKAESEARTSEIREKYRKRNAAFSVWIDIKAEISKARALTNQLLIANGYSQTYNSGNRMLFIAEVPPLKANTGGAVITQNKFYLFTQVTAVSKQTNVDIYITPVSNSFSAANKPARDAIERLETKIKSILKNIKREAENSH